MDYVCLICSCIAFLLYCNTLWSGFVYDDRRAILSNPDLLPGTPWLHLLRDDFWGTPMSDSGSHGSYRPLSVLTFRLNYLFDGFQPFGYHLVNVLLHCFATGLLVRVARHVLPKSRASKSAGPAITGLVFATHPIHTEAVAGVVGRADLVACNLYFLSFLLYVAHVKYRDYGTCCAKHQRGKEGYLGGRYRYQKLMVHLQKNVTNCNWSRKLGKDVVYSNPVEGRLSEASCWKGEGKAWCYLGFSVLLAVASMLSKEPGITVLGVCAIFDLLHSPNVHKRQWRSLIILGTVAVIVMAIRLGTTTPEFSTADNPAARDKRLVARVLTFLYLPVFNFFLLIYPKWLSFDWGMDAIPRLESVYDPRNFTSLFFYLVLCLWVRYLVLKVRARAISLRKSKIIAGRVKSRFCNCNVCHQGMTELHSTNCRNSNNNNSMGAHSTCVCPAVLPVRCHNQRHKGRVAALLGLTFMVIPFLPATNLLFYVGFVVAERVLYIPSAGLCLLLGLGGGRLWEREGAKRAIRAWLILVLVGFSAKTVMRNRDWVSEETLYRSAVEVNPPKAYGNLGSILNGQGRLAEAEWAYRKALSYRPNMADVHYNLGVLLQSKQQLSDAILSYQRAIHFRPSLALAYVNLGNALIAAGRCHEAVNVLLRGSRLDGTGLRDRREHETARVSALMQLGALYSDQGMLQSALAVYRQAATSLPNHYPKQSVFNVLGETLALLQEDEEAEMWYQAALNAQPDHVPAHITYGKLLAKNVSRTAEAEQWFRRAQKLAPNDYSVYHHYGEFLASRGRHKEAAALYEKAAELKPQNYELALAAANAMSQAGRYQDAEDWYRTAVSLKPTDARGHRKLGTVLHLNGKLEEAVVSYKEALRLQPNDVTTSAHLHKLHSVMT